MQAVDRKRCLMVKEDFAFETVRDIFTAFLKKKKMRKTPERFAILEKIYQSEVHFDAESLCHDMQEEYRVSLATVYNTIDILLDCSLIVKHPFAGQTAKFEKTFGKQTHHHLICSKCGSVKEFSDKKIRTMLKAKTFATFETTHYSLYLYGFCNKCKPIRNKKNNINK